MRLYVLAVILTFAFMASPLPALAADDGADKVGLSDGARPAKLSSSISSSPAKPGPGSGGHGRPPGGGHGRPPGGGFDKPGRPGDDDRPGFNGGHGRPSHGFDKPGRPGKHRPDRPGGDRNYGWGYGCYPYCYGIGQWSGGDDDDDSQGGTQYEYTQPLEPERPFQGGGAFEWFDDPRGQAAHDSGYPRPSDGQQSPAQFDIDQYHMMMKAWR